MIHILRYGTDFVLKQGRTELSLEEALEVVEATARKLGITSKNVGCSFEKGVLTPSVDFIKSTHLQCEFTGLISNEYKIKRIPKKRD